METLIRAGVNLELSKDDLVSSLMLSHSEEQLVHLREEMFDIAKSTSLAHPRDILVRRLKRAVGPPVLSRVHNMTLAQRSVSSRYLSSHRQFVNIRRLVKRNETKRNAG